MNAVLWWMSSAGDQHLHVQVMILKQQQYLKKQAIWNVFDL
ncbi:hypothetical protein Pan153_44490 [Gimesia panareensis]|uniref:Uncharacterized protein n=1 Tax=Gimesia panareensis TaxID=2527978 RepID=A0A518FTW4_9PLAN|nr:hypothetical protein Pan153_44490 [Gimesia panareensis]